MAKKEKNFLSTSEVIHKILRIVFFEYSLNDFFKSSVMKNIEEAMNKKPNPVIK